MKIKDWTKLIIAAMVLIASSALCGLNQIDSEAAVAIISAVLGYVFGNGHGIMENKMNGLPPSGAGKEEII